MEQAGGFRPAAHTPTQTPLTTHRHGNQGAQEGDAGWAEGSEEEVFVVCGVFQCVCINIRMTMSVCACVRVCVCDMLFYLKSALRSAK